MSSSPPMKLPTWDSSWLLVSNANISVLPPLRQVIPADLLPPPTMPPTIPNSEKLQPPQPMMLVSNASRSVLPPLRQVVPADLLPPPTMPSTIPSSRQQKPLQPMMIMILQPQIPLPLATSLVIKHHPICRKTVNGCNKHAALKKNGAYHLFCEKQYVCVYRRILTESHVGICTV